MPTTLSPSEQPSTQPRLLRRARLPRWLLASDWPQHHARPVEADIHITAQGCIDRIVPSHTEGLSTTPGTTWELNGALVLPGLVDAHTHLDKAFTLRRMGTIRPGLLGAIEAMMADRQTWTTEDIRRRAEQAMQWSHQAGVVHLRTHCDWWEPQGCPLAWQVLRELAQQWSDRLTIERVSLIPLHLFSHREDALHLAATVADSGPGAILGGFVHTTHWNPEALRHLLEAAQTHGLDVDLHIDEELHPDALGLATTARLLRELEFEGQVVCGHACALAAQEESEALAVLDAVARVPITLVTLPITNLLLQDAHTGRTPRQRGITLVKEARARGIPLLVASDNVQDPFCPVGSFDPLEALATGVLAAQLDAPFDRWSDTLCRHDWLCRGQRPAPLQTGTSADLLILPDADAWSFPSRTQHRVVVRRGRVAQGTPAAAWAGATHLRSAA